MSRMNIPRALRMLKSGDCRRIVVLEKAMNIQGKRWVWLVYRGMPNPISFFSVDGRFLPETFDHRPDAKRRALALAEKWRVPILYEGPQR